MAVNQYFSTLIHPMSTQVVCSLSQFFANGIPIQFDEGFFLCPISNFSPAMHANSVYFGHAEWAKGYLDVVHRDRFFQERWQACIGDWQGKIVVDIGCGPGNVYAALKECMGTPHLMIGVDVSAGGLKTAESLGYTPVLADAQDLPFIDGFADIVTLNATLHHCDDMEKVLREAARLVRPGGLLLTDHDLQRSMWNDNWIAKFIWNARLPVYRWLRRGGHSTADEQYWSTATEAHHMPGDGVTPEFFQQILEPMGFTVELYPHNRTAGAEAIRGERGRAEWKVRWAQKLCGVDPDSKEGALVMMCVARRSKQD
jgi:ubiquinone/menaquinone biosynthesis C-methylase UbiE